MASDLSASSLRVATFELQEVSLAQRGGSPQPNAEVYVCKLMLKCKDGSQLRLSGAGDSEELAIGAAVTELCLSPIQVKLLDTSSAAQATEANQRQYVVAVNEAENASGVASAARPQRAGVGRVVAEQPAVGMVAATLRAANHAGLLKAAYRANNQKVFREWSAELVTDLRRTLGIDSIDELKRLEAEGVVLEHLNRVASAAVLTAANHPRPDSILSLFDTSAWLFDRHGARRDSYMDTNLWLAWYPGIKNDEETVDDVIRSMPAAPESAIPWIVKLFENPGSWLRFRGAVDLEDHDVMHVLLGRGLQDQDEAFVIGFAMGTAKRVSWFQYWVFKLVLARLYPEPYRVPKFLQPAFDLGVKCGQETGVKDLYKGALKELRPLTLKEARERAGIDVSILRRYFELEQQQIPFTIASLRLP